MDNKNYSKYAETVMSKVEILSTTGKFYKRKIYKINKILEIYIENMKIKYSNMGDQYLLEMINNINTIFKYVSRYTNYDTLEFVDLVIIYTFKIIDYNINENKVKKVSNVSNISNVSTIPTLPDYTISEIKEFSKLFIYI